MKQFLVILFLFNAAICFSQKMAEQTFFTDGGFRCAVAHMNKDGVFTCDMRGIYFPEYIYDSTIRKWFINIVKGDSIFYYRKDVIDIYIWNGRPKNEEYGYESEQMHNTGLGITLPDKYNGSDTLRRKNQVWEPKPTIQTVGRILRIFSTILQNAK